MRSGSQDVQTDDAGGKATSLPAFGAFMSRTFVCSFALFVFAFNVMTVTGASAQAANSTEPGTVIRNTAVLEFARPGGGTVQSFSNAVTATVEPAPTRSTISLLRATETSAASLQTTAGPTACRNGGTFVPLASPTVVPGGAVNPMQPIAMTTTTNVHGGEAVFVQIVDADQNRDAAAIDTLELRLTSVNGDSEVIRLSETGFSTGTFVGYIQTRVAAAVAGDCVLQVERNSQLTSSYVDVRDATDAVSASALIDPFGLVFDSNTGQPVNGSVVRLVDAATGQAATVFGDDGVSRYPATMTTGAQVTDSGGTVYTLPAGVFRFPLVAAGQYRLEVTPPLSHTFPSQRTTTDLNSIPGAPFRLQAGSFGNNFGVASPPAVAIDVPLDPSNAQLFLQKTTTTTTAAPGDFVQYTLTIENTGDAGIFQSVRIDDQLPWGMRYRSGSTRRGAQVTADPSIGADGRSLSFAIAQLAPRQRIVITYVAEITQSARGPDLTNSAHAVSGNGASSNTTRATIRLREDFFRDKALLAGRIVAGECEKPVNELTGIGGVRVYLEDGRYALTDEDGKYHFEGVEPGSHVVQMDTMSIPAAFEPQLCKGTVAHSGRAYSQFVDLRAGALWRVDFKLAKRKPPQGRVALQLASTQSSEMELAHSILVNVEGNPITNARLVTMLPSGIEYVPGSAQRGNSTLADPSNNGGVLMFALDSLAPTGAHSITFRSKVAPEAAGALPIQAYLIFDTPGATKQLTAPAENRVLRGEMSFEKASYRFSPRFDVAKAELKAEDRVQLDKLVNEWRGVRNLHVTAIGHTDATPIVTRSTQFKDNYELSHARAEAVADYLRSRLNLKSEQMVVDGKGADEPLSPGKDAASLARNRRVEIFMEGTRVQSLGRVSLATARGEGKSVATEGLIPGVRAAANSATEKNKKGDIDVETIPPGIAWLAPAAGAIPAISSVKVAIAHAPNQKAELLVNGKSVSALNFDGVVTNQAKTVAVSHWIGIDLLDGENEFKALIVDADGNEIDKLTRMVHFAGGAVRAEFAAEHSTLAADGKTNPVIALRLFDAADKPARPGTLGAFSLDEPYRSQWEVDALRDNPLLAYGARQPTFRVDDDGIARIELEPTTQTGNVLLRLQFNERQTQEIRVWLKPEARDWVMVGIAEGTGAHKTISDNMQAANEAGIEEGFDKDGRVAFFAKGRIKGEYLLTVAFDSARERKPDERRMLGAIEPDRYYTVYGDGAEQRFEAASQEKLFLKLERNQFMAMFGDFQTGLTVTELSRYSRSLTGAKSDFANDRFSLSTFAAQTDQGFVKNEMPGDGTSGLYRLTSANLVVNSDKVRLETRDRFRSEIVVTSRPLARFIDYTIDYFNGTLFFKQPVPSRDENFNPIYVVAEYEVAQGGKEQIVAGTRAAVKLAGDTVEIGASYLHEGAQIGDTHLAGTDVLVKLGEHTTVRAEVARSDTDDPSRVPTANAYFTEVKHVSERIDASAYLREQDTQFGFGQQFSTETGTRKIGLDSRIKLGEFWAVRAEAFEQTMLNATAERQMASAEVRRETERYGLGVGARHVSDAGLQTGELVSDLASLNGHVNLWNDRITLKGAYDSSLGGAAESMDYPARSLIGIDYKLTGATTLFSEYEHSDGAQFDSDMTRIGLRTSPWQRAQLSSTMNQQFTEYGPRTFANLGLTQGWQINERWSIDFGVDQNKTIRGSSLPIQAAATRNRLTPLSSGSIAEDFLASSVAAMYRSIDWTFTSRVEHRDSDTERRWNYVGGFYREAVRGQAFSLQANFLSSDAGTRGDTTAALVRLSWAYRPVSSEWIVLDRLDLKRDRREDAFVEFESSRAVNNLNANWQLNARTQLGLQFGARYVVSTFDGERYAGYSDLYGFDTRRDLSDRFDVGFHGAWLHSWTAGTSDATAGIDLGISVARNMWVSVGFNFVGFDDKDFAATRYTAQGPFIKFRMKVDQDTFKDLSLDSLRPSRSQAN